MRVASCLSLFLAALIAGAAIAAPLPNEAHLAKMLAERLEKNQGVGLAIGLYDASEGSAPRFVVAGEALKGSGRRVDADSVFEAGSISKAFTGVLLASLVQEGRIALDAPAAQYLPNASLPTLEGKPITVLHLATHTSGLPRLPTGFKVTDPSNPYGAFTEADLYRALAETKLATVPGQTSEYSNFGYMLLSHLLVKVSGKSSYEALVRERILTPLGMDRSGTSLNASSTPFAMPHGESLAPVPVWTLTPTLAGVGGLQTSATDLMKFARAQLDTSTKDKLASAMAMAREARHSASPTASIGLAWQIRKTPSGKTIVWHNGGTGGSRSFIGFEGASRQAVVILANSAHDVTSLGMHLLDPEGTPLQRVRPAVTLDAALLEALAGEYEAEGNTAIHLMRAGSRLMARLEGKRPEPLSAESPTLLYTASGALEIDVLPAGADAPRTLRLREGDKVRTVTKRAAKPFVNVDRTLLSRYVGTYKVANRADFVVAMADDHLTLKTGGSRAFRLWAESPTEFVIQELQARVAFAAKDDKPAAELTWTQLGSSTKAARVE